MKSELETQRSTQRSANTTAVKVVLAYDELSSGKLEKELGYPAEAIHERANPSHTFAGLHCPAHLKHGVQAALHRLKLKLLQSALETSSNARLLKRLCGSANRAAELAWATPYPLLVFPCLFEEMAEQIHAPSKKTADATAIAAKPHGLQASSEVSCLC
jgi:hypothetical protein